MQILSEFGWGWWLVLLITAVIIGIIIGIAIVVPRIKVWPVVIGIVTFLAELLIAGVCMVGFGGISHEADNFESKPYRTDIIRPQEITSVHQGNVLYLDHDTGVLKGTDDLRPTYNIVKIDKVSIGQPRLVLKSYAYDRSSAFHLPKQWLPIRTVITVRASKSQIRLFDLDPDNLRTY